MQITEILLNSERRNKNQVLGARFSRVLGLFLEYCVIAGVIMSFMVGSRLLGLGRIQGIGGYVPPLFARFDVHSPNLFLAFPIAVFTVFFFIFHWFSTRLHRIHGALIVAFFLIFSILLDITVAMIDGGIGALVHPFTRTDLEYYGVVSEVKGASSFLKDFVSMLPSFKSVHVATHPPGPVLFLWAVSRLFGDGVLIASLSVIIFGSFSIIPVYLLSRDLYGKEVGFYTIALYALTPSIIMFTATSMDGVFAFFPAWCIYFFFKAIKEEYSLMYPILSGLSFAMGMFMTIGILIIGLFFIIVGLYYAITRQSVFDIFRKMLTFLLVVLGFYLLLYITTGFNALECFSAISKLHIESVTGPYITSRGSYLYWRFGNLFAILLFIGIPIALLFLKEAGISIMSAIKDKQIDAYVLASAVTLIVVIFAELVNGEMERLVLFLSPFFIIPSAKHLLKLLSGKDMRAVASMTLIILFVQTLSLESLLYTFW